MVLREGKGGRMVESLASIRQLERGGTRLSLGVEENNQALRRRRRILLLRC
jgi:hypothetical protein